MRMAMHQLLRQPRFVTVMDGQIICTTESAAVVVSVCLTLGQTISQASQFISSSV